MGVRERFGLDPEAVGSRSGRELRSTGSFSRGTAYWRRLGPARETGGDESELWPELAVDVKGL